MAKPWTKLDLDFYTDPKVLELIDMSGKAAAWDWLCLSALANDMGGSLELSKRSVRERVSRMTALRGKRLDSLIDKCVSVGLFDERFWGEYEVVTSKRIETESANRRMTSSVRSEAGKASGEARRKKSEATNQA